MMKKFNLCKGFVVENEVGVFSMLAYLSFLLNLKDGEAEP
jgi:hypothetical protein